MQHEDSDPNFDHGNQPVPRQADLVSEQQDQITFISRTWTGPLPSPNDLGHYDDVLPGAAERILAMAERENEHRHLMESKESTRSLIGLIFGFAVAMVTLLAGAFLIYTGYVLAGAIIVGIDLVGLAAVFVYGSRSYQQETFIEDPEPES